MRKGSPNWPRCALGPFSPSGACRADRPLIARRDGGAGIYLGEARRSEHRFATK